MLFIIFQVTSGYCTTGCTSPSYAFVGLSAVLAGHGGTGRIAEGSRPASGFVGCWKMIYLHSNGSFTLILTESQANLTRD